MTKVKLEFVVVNEEVPNIPTLDDLTDTVTVELTPCCAAMGLVLNIVKLPSLERKPFSYIEFKCKGCGKEQAIGYDKLTKRAALALQYFWNTGEKDEPLHLRNTNPLSNI